MATSKAVVVKAVRLDQLRGHEALQMRDGIDPERAERFRQMVEDGEDFDGKRPVVFHDGTDYWLADGYTRQAGYAAAGKKKMDCEVHPGTFDDAVLYAAGANARHGLPLQHAGEKLRAIKTVLMHRATKDWSERDIARHVGCSKGHVYRAKQDLTGSASAPRGADAPAVPDGLTVEQAEKWQEVAAAGGTPRLVERTGQKPYVQDAGKVNAGRQPKPPSVVKQLASVTDAQRRKAVWLGIPVDKVGRLERALSEDGTRVWLSEDEDAPRKLADQLGIPAEAVVKALKEPPPADTGEAPAAEPDESPDPAATVDAKGRPIPAGIREAFDPELQTKIGSMVQRYGHDFAELKALIEQRHPFVDWAWPQGLQTDYGNLQNALAAFVPYIVCPACGGTKHEAGDIIPDGPPCNFCKRNGHLPHGSWKGLTDEMKAVAESFAKTKEG